MASVSLSFTVAQNEDLNPENITAGSSAPGAGDIELRVDTAKFTTGKQIRIALDKLILFVDDEKYGPSTFLVL